MKRVGIITTATLFLLLGTTAPAYVQHEQEGNEHGKSQEGQEHQQKGQSAQHQQGQQHQQQAQHQQPAQEQHQQPAQHQRQASQPAPRQSRQQQSYGGEYHGGVQSNGPVHGGVHHSGVPQRQEQVHSGFGQSRAHDWNDDHRTWRQRGGYNGYRVPEERFRLYFGNSHFFRINSLPMVFVGGYPRFQYDGYWVTFADPWPEQWPDTWYQTDDTYLDYSDDGYYLYNRSRPGPGIAVTINF